MKRHAAPRRKGGLSGFEPKFGRLSRPTVITEVMVEAGAISVRSFEALLDRGWCHTHHVKSDEDSKQEYEDLSHGVARENGLRKIRRACRSSSHRAARRSASPDTQTTSEWAKAEKSAQQPEIYQ
jgi:hypothetical protein